jgi:hypothetical protein
MNQAHQISPDHLSSLFVADGDKKLNGAPFTIRSKKTMKDFTFKIAQKPFKGYPYLHVSVEKGYLDFGYMGYFRDGQIVKKNKLTGTTEVVRTPAANAVAWLLRQLKAKKYAELTNDIQLFHTGHCLKCGKVLTDAVSITSGFGPICRHS